MSPEEIEITLTGSDEKGSNTRNYTQGLKHQNLDVYQVNCTYYSALECSDVKYRRSDDSIFCAGASAGRTMRVCWQVSMHPTGLTQRETAGISTATITA